MIIMQRGVFSWVVLAVLLFLGACRQQPRDGGDAGGDIVTEARLLSMVPDENGTLVEITNPWDTTRLLARYYLCETPGVNPHEGATMIKVPLQRSAVYGSVHMGVIEELGALDRVSGMADAQYIRSVRVGDLLSQGQIVDLGSSMSPSLERIVALAPDALLVSPFENSGHGALDNAGLNFIEMADYMESTPLGRAEWIRFIGRLYGRGPEADSIFAKVKADYSALVAGTGATLRPRVLTEQVTDGYWFVPGGRSYMARLLADAGGDYPWADDTSAGSLQLDFSAVLAKASDADYWLIKTYGSDLTLEALESQYPLNARFKAFGSGGVFACNTARSPLFEEFPFHPEWLLADYAAIFRGETQGLRYFKQVR